MARADNRYSRFVAWLKVLLPLAALALLSMLFLLARGPAGADRPLLDEALRELAITQTLTAPNFSAVTEEGDALSVAARTATPRAGAPDLIDVADLSAELDRPGGARITLTAPAGTLDRDGENGRFFGGVEVKTTDGYRLATEVLTATLDGSLIASDRPVRIEGPDLTIEAGAMTATETGGQTAGHILFKDGVRLVYTPRTEERPE